MRNLPLIAVGFVFCSLLASAASIDAFENADFEDNARNGRIDKFAVAGRGYGWNQGGGVRLSGFRREVFVLPVKKDLRLKKGERYLFTLQTRCSNPVVLCQIALETWNPKDGSYEGYWGRKEIDIGGGWKREELSFVPKRDLDASKEKVNFILLYCLDPKAKVEPGRPQDYVDLDNATLSNEEALWLFCNTWPTHNWVFSEDGFVRAKSSFVGEFLKKDAKPEYTLALAAPDGTVIARAAARATDGVLEASFGRIAYAGPAVLSATLVDRGKRLGTRTRDVTVRKTYEPKKGEAFVNRHGQVLVDGKPFMPLGFYTNLADPSKHSTEQLERELKRLHEAGFNFMIDYASYLRKSKESQDAYYGLCEKYGIRVLVDNFAGYQQTPEKIGEIGPLAQKLAKYPAIIGWYTMDEASEDKVPVLDRIRRELNKATPGHLVQTCNIVAPEPFLPSADIQGGDQYPITADPDAFERADRYMRRAAACRPAAAWFAPQGYNGANYDPVLRDDRAKYLEKGREPTVNEMLAVTLSFIANGVSGFAFYSHFDLTRGPVPELYEKRWQDVVTVARTLRSIEKYVVGARRPADLPHTDVRGKSRVVLKYADDGRAMVVVYGFKPENEATFRLPADVGPLVSTCGYVTQKDGVCTYKGKNLSCDILK